MPILIVKRKRDIIISSTAINELAYRKARFTSNEQLMIFPINGHLN